MKKFITNVIIFFVLEAVIDLAVGMVGDYLHVHTKGGETKRINDLCLNDQHDIIVFGSSRAHHHYDTQYLSDSLGLDVYNAGFDGNGVVLACGLLDLVLDRYEPKLILYDVMPAFDIYVFGEDNNNIRYLSPLKPYYRQDEVGKIIRKVSNEEWYKVHSGMIRYNSILLTMWLDCYNSRGEYFKGYEPLYEVYCGEPEKECFNYNRIDPIKMECMEHLIASAQTRGIPIVMVASPNYGEESLLSFEPVIELCLQYDVPFLDYYAKPVFMEHKEWYKNPLHLNQTGARIFSGLILREINQMLEKQDNEQSY